MSEPKICTKNYQLNTGSFIPAVGLGTWQVPEKGVAYEVVKKALEAGYRHIDTASAYDNEEEIGSAIRDSNVPRSEIFVTTKLWCKDHIKVEEALDESLKKLKLDYVDLYLMHWPVAIDPKFEGKFGLSPTGERTSLSGWSFLDTWHSMEKLASTGKVKALGVSNFSKKNLDLLLKDAETKIVPAVDQIEAHPLLTQPSLLKFCLENNILVEAYSPLGSTNSPLFKNDVIVNMSKKYSVEPAQILISWAVQRGTVVLPKSVNPSRIESNLRTFVLKDEDMEILNTLSDSYGIVRTCNPNWGKVTVFNDEE